MQTILSLGMLLIGSTFNAEKVSTIEELQQEKVVALKQILDDVSQGHKEGAISITEVYKAQLAYLDGALELTKTHQERLEIHEQSVRAADELLKAYQELLKASNASRADVLRSKVILLDRRIALAKEQQLAN